MPVSDLYTKDNYIINAKFIHNVTITEYDIKQANISVLASGNYITPEEYHKLSILPKKEREVYIGKKIAADPSVYKHIKEGILEARKNLFEWNQIEDREVLRIANDAVYVIRNAPLRRTTFWYTEFIKKHSYTSFLRLDSISILFSSFLGDLDIDVIGMSPENMQLHQDYMLNFIANILYMIETCPPLTVMENFDEFYRSYITRSLDIGYYRTLDAKSMYILKTSDSRPSTFGLSDYTGDVNLLDIGYNAAILRDIYSILGELYTTKRG